MSGAILAIVLAILGYILHGMLLWFGFLCGSIANTAIRMRDDPGFRPNGWYAPNFYDFVMTWPSWLWKLRRLADSQSEIFAEEETKP